MCKYFHLQTLDGCLINIYATESLLSFFFCFKFDLLRVSCSLSMKLRKRFAHIIKDTCATHSGFVYVTDPNCQAQNGSTHSSVCLQLSHFHFFNKLHHKLTLKKNCYMSPFYYSPPDRAHIVPLQQGPPVNTTDANKI